jgi:hypothetical protein
MIAAAHHGTWRFSVTTHPDGALMGAGYEAYTNGDLASLSDHVCDDFPYISRT